MKTIIFLFSILITAFVTETNDAPELIINKPGDSNIDPSIIGQWVRMAHTGPIKLYFKNNGLVESDLNNDEVIEVCSEYKIANDTITFYDRNGKTCLEAGFYKVKKNDYYMAFDLIKDECGGRIRSTMGFWVRPDFEVSIEKLKDKISSSAKPEHYLNRARMYLALGKAEEARYDLDYYIECDATNPRVFLNRAATKFPDDFPGALDDCNRSIELDPHNKNAHFLKGLALYSLGKHEEACESFDKAIELGFTVLKEAEKDKCAEY